MLCVNYISIKLGGGNKIKFFRPKNRNYYVGPEKQYGLIHVKHTQSTEECPRLQAVTILWKDRNKEEKEQEAGKI